MTTGTVLLPAAGAELDATNPPGVAFVNGRRLLLFDDTVDEFIYYTFRMPQDYASAPVLKFQYSHVAAANEVIIACQVMAVTDGEDVDDDSYDTVNTSGATTVPGTQGLLDEISLALTNADSLAAGDYVALKISRDADNVGDDAVGDLEFWGAALEYTTV